MWKGFLHTSRYSYYDLLMLSIASTLYAQGKIEAWLGVAAFWFVTMLFVELHYNKKK